MFDKEVVIGGLKKNSEVLRKLVEEMESKPKLGTQDVQYYHEELKKLESALRKIRRFDESLLRRTGYSSYGVVTHAW